VHGFDIDLSKPTVPWGNWAPEDCDPFIEDKPCTAFPRGFISSHTITDVRDERIIWRGGFLPERALVQRFRILNG
jgi:hypothetical protein